MKHQEKLTKDTFNPEAFTFIDLGLPSGRLWATENIKDEDGNEAYVSFDKAVETYGDKLPTKEEWKELFDNSSYSWNEERKGYDVTGPNGNSIFLPAAGYRHGASVCYVGGSGFYWSSSVLNLNRAYNVLFTMGYLNPRNRRIRCNGFSVRLVR